MFDLLSMHFYKSNLANNYRKLNNNCAPMN